jgi:hypothetical protein
MSRHAVTRLSFLCLAVFLAGCSSYAPVRQAEPRTIALRPIINKSEAPQVIAPLSRNLREALAHSGDWRLVEGESADVVLQITVLELDRGTISRDPGDTGRPLSYYEELKASIEWQSELPAPWGAKPVTVVSANTLLYAQPSLVSAESAAMGELANDLAARILSRINWPADSAQP